MHSGTRTAHDVLSKMMVHAVQQAIHELLDIFYRDLPSQRNLRGSGPDNLFVGPPSRKQEKVRRKYALTYHGHECSTQARGRTFHAVLLNEMRAPRTGIATPE